MERQTASLSVRNMWAEGRARKPLGIPGAKAEHQHSNFSKCILSKTPAYFLISDSANTELILLLAVFIVVALRFFKRLSSLSIIKHFPPPCLPPTLQHAVNL